VDELPGHQTHRIRHLFDGEHLALVIDAIIAVNSPATVWVDDAAAPCAAAIWDGGHCVYIVGPASRVAAFRAAVSQRIGPAGPGLVKIYATDAAARLVFAGHDLDRLERVFYRFDRGGQAPMPVGRLRLPAGFGISSITEEFDRLASFGNFADVTAEVESCWPSLAEFRRAGFGFCAHDADSIVCWCTAEYVSDGRCGIGIETIPAFRNRGLATLTATAFVEHCAARGITPHWDSWSSNAPSVAVAEKIGFRAVETYSIFVVNLP
jgi:GNAT superfamily N-acetyltransferase